MSNTIGGGIAEYVRLYQAQIQGFIRRRVNSTEDAEDILQDVMYQLAKVENPIENVSAWLYHAARNRIIDWWRKKKADPLAEYIDEIELASSEMANVLYNETDSPESEYLRKIVWQEIEIALSELPEEQRSVFELTEYAGLSYKEISESSSIPINTLISRKHYAVLYLRGKLTTIYYGLMQR